MPTSHLTPPQQTSLPRHSAIDRLDGATAHAIWRRTGLEQVEQAMQALCAHSLMDLAGLATAQLTMALAPHAQRICILAGPGNNGGDGLEAAWQLHQSGRVVEVHLLAQADRLPPNAQRAWQRAQQGGVRILTGASELPVDLTPQDLWIDALLGTGARRAPEGQIRAAIHHMHNSAAPVLSIDLPSGLDADSGQALGEPNDMVRAQHTLTMIAAKPGLLMGHGRDVCGQLWRAPLVQAPLRMAPDAEINPAPPVAAQRHASHKGTRGDVAIVGGEDVSSRGMGMRGAALLAASAALHAGAGCTLLAWAQAPYTEMGSLPEVMLRQMDALDWATLTVVLGCGGGRSILPHMESALQRSARLVLDADALNALAADRWLQELLQRRAEQRLTSVMTPHPLEAARLLGCSTTDIQADRLGAAQHLSERYRATVVLKGSGTVIAQSGHTPRINITGNGRLAVGGTGDVLAGFIGACWAQCLDPWQASTEAVWRHGRLAEQWPADRQLTAGALAQSWH